MALAQTYAHHATVINDRGDRFTTTTWAETDVVQWTSRQSAARARYVVEDAALMRRVRGRTVESMIAAARGAGAPIVRAHGATTVGVIAAITTTNGGLSVDERAQVATGVFACGADVGGISTGGYSSGLAAALVLGRIAADAALGVTTALAGLRRAVAVGGGTALGAGIHPSGAWGDARVLSGGRYKKVSEMLRGLVQRTPECALHVHVGVSDGEDAVRILNGMREYVPLFVALAANSPFWFGVDSGMASARAALVRSYPRHGIPRAFRDYDDYLATLDGYRRAFGIVDSSLMWWDVRLRPNLGTVELRGMDSQSSLGHVAALTALAQAMAYAIKDSGRECVTPAELIAESAFLASRDGIAGTILHHGSLQPVRQAVTDTLEWVRPYARDRGIEDGLDGVERLVHDGGGAVRQRRVHARSGMAELLRHLVAESSADRW